MTIEAQGEQPSSIAVPDDGSGILALLPEPEKNLENSSIETQNYSKMEELAPPRNEVQLQSTDGQESSPVDTNSEEKNVPSPDIDMPHIDVAHPPSQALVVHQSMPGTTMDTSCSNETVAAPEQPTSLTDVSGVTEDKTIIVANENVSEEKSSDVGLCEIAQTPILDSYLNRESGSRVEDNSTSLSEKEEEMSTISKQSAGKDEREAETETRRPDRVPAIAYPSSGNSDKDVSEVKQFEPNSEMLDSETKADYPRSEESISCPHSSALPNVVKVGSSSVNSGPLETLPK